MFEGTNLQQYSRGAKFWIVLRLDIPTAATVRHTTHQEATAEAKRLALENPGVEFGVFAIEKSFRAVSPLAETRY